MDRYREKTSTLFTGFVHGLSRKQRPVITPLSKSLGFPVPQTSLSMSARLTSLDRVLTYYIFQFSNSQTSSSFPFYLISPQTRGSPVIVHGSVPRIQ